MNAMLNFERRAHNQRMPNLSRVYLTGAGVGFCRVWTTRGVDIALNASIRRRGRRYPCNSDAALLHKKNLKITILRS